MCWSSTADLVAGGAVAVVGAAALPRVRRIGELPLAALPLLLGLHQLTEAVVWLGAEGGTGPAEAAAARMLWAAIAYPVLPLYLPLAVLAAAAPARRPALLVFVLVGALTSAALAWDLAHAAPDARIAGHTLRYGVGVGRPLLVGAGYLLATVGALLASGQRGIRLLGVVTGVGALLCLLLWQAAFVSTWCALAAVSSVLVLRWVSGLRRNGDPGVDPGG
ncbi:DUF6629 family protein [Streptacidiphilus sp. EB129]|uniref:DUF6629 family protein n=1 Tax=Streptacidiphilus sp. EB129 TaxID=3156262 RepID=UPI003517E1EE